MYWGCRLLQTIYKSLLKSDENLLHSRLQLLHVLKELCSSRTLNGMKSICGTEICYTCYLWPAHNSCWRHRAHLYSWPFSVARVFVLCFTCMHVLFSQYTKNIVDQIQNTGISQFLNSITSFTEESVSRHYTIPPFPGMWLYSGTWKNVISIPSCCAPGLNLGSCQDALLKKLLFFIGCHSVQHSQDTQGNWEGAIFNYFFYLAAH